MFIVTAPMIDFSSGEPMVLIRRSVINVLGSLAAADCFRLMGLTSTLPGVLFSAA